MEGDILPNRSQRSAIPKKRMFKYKLEEKQAILKEVTESGAFKRAIARKFGHAPGVYERK